ncbi:MAG: hypothetical protein WDW36_009221 [Sanguina aurantia]
MADPGSFAIGDRVLVPHTDKFYEAKILRAEKREDKLWYYLLHYSGWNKKYDEWVEATGFTRPAVSETALVAATPAPATAPPQRAPKKLLQKNFQQTSTTQRRLDELGGGTVVGISAAEASGPGASGASLGSCALGLEVEFPLVLKQQLVADYDLIVEDGLLVPLPRQPCVSEVLQRYVTEANAFRGSSVNEAELASGLTSYFDKSLHALLLYRSERPQAQAMLSDGKVPSAVYGAEHLLRLFIKLPDLFMAAGVSEEQLGTLGAMVQDVVNWMADNASTLFLDKKNYMTAA